MRSSWVGEVADTTATEVTDAWFGVVLALSSLEHIPGQRWRTAIKEIERPLRPSELAMVAIRNRLDFACYSWSKRMQASGRGLGSEECTNPWAMKAALQDDGFAPSRLCPTSG
jgi:hypothetical protein